MKLTEPLNDNQLAAIGRLQRAAGNLAKLAAQINEAIEANGLPLDRLRVPDVGRLVHDASGLLFHHYQAVNLSNQATQTMAQQIDAGEYVL